MRKNKVVLLLALLICFITNSVMYTEAHEEFAYGADVGWLSQLEEQGYTWKNSNGSEGDVLDILAQEGINAIRLRVFVQPPSSFTWTKNDGTTCLLGYCDTAGLMYMAERANEAGFDIMLDFHYSDHFADPEYQNIPTQWENADYNTLVTYVYDYTYYIMNQLAQKNIYPKWVQVGNEINSGILLPYGSSDNYFSQLAGLLNSGYDAVKAVSPSSKVITHLANGQNNSMFIWFFDNFLTTYNGKTDIIGMSYYPYWIGSDFTNNINDLADNLQIMSSRYNKEVMICEIGGHENNENNTYELIQAAIDAVNAVPNEKGVGVFYWEPEVNSSVLPDGYVLGACKMEESNTIKFTNAISAFNMSPDEIFPNEKRYYKIINKNSSMALNVMGGSQSNSSVIEQYGYDKWNSQMWNLEEVEAGYYKIINRNSGKVLDIMGNSVSSGADCIQYEYNGGWNQQWSLVETNDGYYNIVNRNSGMALEISNSSISAGASCIQAALDNSDNQKWIIQVVN